MATEFHQFSATIPAGTDINSPISIPLEQANYEIESIDLEVPPGPSGLMGFYIALGDTPWLPWESNTWIVWDDRADSWPTENQIVNGGWNVVGYNAGKYDHTVTIRFHTNPIPVATDDTYTPYVPPTVVINSTPLVQEPVLL
jgi:hypothetical protein